MRAKIREILEECIETGIESGYLRAHKYNDNPYAFHIYEQIGNAIWLEIDQRFDFERNVCDEVVEGFDHLEESYDQTALELCERCGWRALIPEDGCLNCNRLSGLG